MQGADKQNFGMESDRGTQIMIKRFIAIGCMFVFICSFIAFENMSDVNTANKAELTVAASSEEKTAFIVDTTITYTDGNDNNWTYGDQKKEFSTAGNCYVRIGSIAVTDKDEGVDENLQVIYKFIGVENCEVELADGYGIDLVLEESNVKEFVGALYPKEENKAEESVAVFKYDPSEEGSMTLEIIYDHRVHSQYCKRNTVYFVNDTTQSKEDNGED